MASFTDARQVQVHILAPAYIVPTRLVAYMQLNDWSYHPVDQSS